ncbi:MAG: RHS domain-containing protein [Pseudomonadales bacterium]|nr:RHS domain-containing protein [Pseudomonadales bacterium]MBO6597922.1 RHS domain-containing protein [Pseudomonadales bacterium]MBO6824329.1 RHS domain-containing protein [Pseudomonadales bacterium]
MTHSDSSTTSYEYDDNGNRIKKTETDLIPTSTDTHYLYNTEERLTEVQDHNHATIASYYYDPFGLRLSKTTASGTTYFLYNGEGLAAEYDASGNLIVEYHYGPNKPWMTDPLFKRSANGNYYYYQNGHLGTPQQMITKSGQIVWQGQYTSFGSIIETISLEDNPLRFPGQYHDVETDTYYNYFRDYDPSLGRYIQSDPIGLRGGLNTYGYVHQNPLIYTDPTGEAVPALLLACASNLACAAAARAGVGGIIGGLSAAVGALSDPCFDGSLADVIGIGAAVGAGSSFVPGGGALGGALLRGGLAGAGGNAVGQYAANDGFDGFSYGDALVSGGIGATAMGTGNVVGLSSALNAVRGGAGVSEAMAIGGSHGGAVAGAIEAAGTLGQLPNNGGTNCECRRP